MADRQAMLLAAAAACVVLASRIPFLAADPGADPDAWRIIASGKALFETGRYAVSRFPGYPVPEIAAYLGAAFGVRVMNTATAVMSCVAVFGFCLSLRNLGVRQFVLAAGALGFVPVIYANSTVAMDYVWALGFSMMSLMFCTSRRPVAAGLFLGLAIGSRITSAAMLLPLSLILWAQLEGMPIRRVAIEVVRFGVWTTLIAMLCFAPVAVTYGTMFFTFYEVGGYPPLGDVVMLATVEVWGRVGLIALAFLAVGIVVGMVGAAPAGMPRRNRLVSLAALGGLLIYVGAYVRLPHEAGYLTPAVPFVILLAALHLRPAWLNVFGLLLITSPLVAFGRTGLYEGPVFDDARVRRNALAYAIRIDRALRDLESPAVVLVGQWRPSVLGITDGDVPVNTPLPPIDGDGVVVLYLADAATLERYANEGRRIYYLTGIDDYERVVHGVELQLYGASELPVP